MISSRQFPALQGGLLRVAGNLLQLAESPGQAHRCEALEHVNAQRHADAHHDHPHDELPVGEHSPWHCHAAI